MCRPAAWERRKTDLRLVLMTCSCSFSIGVVWRRIDEEKNREKKKKKYIKKPNAKPNLLSSPPREFVAKKRQA